MLLSKLIEYLRNLFFGKTNNRNDSTIYINGNILTMCDQYPVVSSILIENEQIKAVGDSSITLSMKKPHTKIIDLCGKTMLPGFIDPHSHPDLAAFMYNFIDLSGYRFSKNNEIWDCLSSSIKKYKKNEWIIGKGLDPFLVTDLIIPTIEELDRIAPNNPLVLISHTMHTYWVNSAAFKKSGITKYTPNPTNLSYYDRDSDGNLTGLIVEHDAFEPIRKQVVKQFSSIDFIENTDQIMKHYLKNGITTIATAGLDIHNKYLLQIYKYFASPDKNIVFQLLEFFRIIPTKKKAYPRHFVYLDSRSNIENVPISDPVDNYFDIIGIKLWYDGSPYAGTMITQTHPPISQSHLKQHNDAYDKVYNNIKKYHDKCQLLIHVQGDQAIRKTLDIFEQIMPSGSKYHHRLEHCLMLEPKLVTMMKKLNVTPSFHINHIYYYAEALEQLLGFNTSHNVLPIRTISKSIPFSLHADYPMFDCSPLSLVATAVNRTSQKGTIINRTESISVTEALKSVTIMAAWHLNMEKKIGSIEPGKLADLIIVDQNPLIVNDIPELRKINIISTIINGVMN